MQKNIWIAAKYLRLSIEDGDKAESESIVNQSILIDNYMKSTSDITIVETFKDDGFSGTDFKRPGFQAMLKAIENKEINCIIVKDLSRFGREHIDVDRYIQKVFPQLGVRFIAINDNYDSETANITDTHLVLPVKSFVNDTYCRQNSQKVRSHLSAKRNSCCFTGLHICTCISHIHTFFRFYTKFFRNHKRTIRCRFPADCFTLTNYHIKFPIKKLRNYFHSCRMRFI